MGSETKGLIFSDEPFEPFSTLDLIKTGICDFYKFKLKQSFEKENIKHSTVNPSVSSLSIEEQEKFSAPIVEYCGDGLFKAKLMFPSNLTPFGVESRTLSFLLTLDHNDRKTYAYPIGADKNNNEQSVFNHGIWLSMDNSGSAPDLIATILKRFGDQHSSYLVRNDQSSSVDPDHINNVVKIGSSKPSNIELRNIYAISEHEYKKIRAQQILKLIKEQKPNVDIPPANYDLRGYAVRMKP